MGGLAIVATGAQRLPVVAVPEPAGVTPVRDDVVDHLGGDDQAAVGAAHTQRVFP